MIRGKRKFNKLAIVCKRRLSHQVLTIAIKTRFIKLVHLGFYNNASAICMINDPVMQHLFRHNTECEKHQ